MVFPTFILQSVESKFTLLTYLMENNTVITVICYCTKGLNKSKTKPKPIPTIYTTKHSFVNTVMRFPRPILSIIIILQESSMNVRMQRGFRVKRCTSGIKDVVLR